MAKFTDGLKREWTITVTTGAIKKVRKALNIDLADIDQATYSRLANDPILLVDLLWLLMEAAAKQREVTEESFAEGLVGDPIDSATAALLEAVADFFPAQKRSLLKTATAKQLAVQQKGLDLAIAKVGDPTLEAKLVEAMETKMDREVEDLLIRLISPTSSPANAE